MRLFLGSLAVVDNIEAIKHDFSMLRARWTPNDNIHLTYLFLGNKYDPDSIYHKLKGIKYNAKTIPIKGLGYFGKPPRILYGAIQDNSLQQLHKELAKRLGIELEHPFIPHITLARIKKVEDEAAFQNLLKSYRDKVLGEMRMELKLFASELTPSGSKYTILRRF